MDSMNYALIVLFTAIALVLFLVWFLVAVPQRRSRQTQEQVVAELEVGEEIVTVGGLIGKLTYIDRAKDLAKIEIAKGIEVRIIPAAISHPLDIMARIKRAEKQQSKK